MVQPPVPHLRRGIPEPGAQILALAQADGRAAGHAVQRVGGDGHIGVQLARDIPGQPAQQRAASCQQNAGAGHIRRQLGRGAFQHVAGCVGNTGGQLLHGFVQVAGIDDAPRGQVRLPRVAAHLHNALKLAPGAAGDLLFQLLGGQRADGDLVFFLHVLGNAAVKGVARHRQAGGLDPPAHADDRNVGGAAADVHDHAAVGLADLQARAQRRRHRLVHKVDLPGARRHDGLHNGVRFDAGDGRGHADRNARLEDARAADLIDKPDDQLVRHAVVLDDAVPQRAHQVNVRGCAAHHF